jgi:hypothetical protein
MPRIERRTFLGRFAAAASSAALVDLSFLAPLSHATASSTALDSELVRFGPELDPLLKLIEVTPLDRCVPEFIKQLESGLSYERFLAVLFLEALRSGDAHQVCQVHSCHQISSAARIEERLLPLFWALYRLRKELDVPGTRREQKTLPAALPKPDRAASILRDALCDADADLAERAAVVLARTVGARQAMSRLWEFAGHSIHSLGHDAIVLANSWRTLDTMGWQHAEIALRYATRGLGLHRGDRTYAPNLARVERFLPRLPADWTSLGANRNATLEVYALLRQGNADSACALICSQLQAGKVKAGAVWDAIHLSAADYIFRYSRGGTEIGGNKIHAITATSALRFGFSLIDSQSIRLLNLLQAASWVADFFVTDSMKDGRLRDMNLVELVAERQQQQTAIADVFAHLPYKANEYYQKKLDERIASDEACRMAFTLLSDPTNERVFLRTARSLLCIKASLDPHDIKYPAAAFEDAFLASAEWRPYLLASSVHALHGTKSDDTPVLVQAREALKSRVQ